VCLLAANNAYLGNKVMNDEPKKSTGMQPRDKWIPWYFVAFFAVVFAVNGFFAYKAVSTMPGVVDTHHYEKGLKYNELIAAAEKQAKLGWKCDVQFKSSADAKDAKKGKVQVVIVDGEGVALEKAQVQVVFMRPAQYGLDKDVVLKEVAAGNYENDMTLPAVGQWLASVAVVKGDDKFTMNKRLVIK
jgi:nitrogen fixation protein FixH